MTIRPVIAVAHVSDDRPATLEYAGQIDVDDALPILIALIPDRGRLAGDAGVVDEDVDTSRLRQDLLDHGLGRRRAGDVDADRKCLRADAAEAVGRRRGRCGVAVGDRDPRTGPCEARGDAFADALSRAGDDRRLPRQVEEHLFFFRFGGV